MVKIKGNKVYITRGDSVFLTINIYETDGSLYELKEGDYLMFSVKSKATDENYAIPPKKLKGRALEIESKDTYDLAFGDYLYDVVLTTKNGYTNTIIQPSLFSVQETITAYGDR